MNIIYNEVGYLKEELIKREESFKDKMNTLIIISLVYNVLQIIDKHNNDKLKQTIDICNEILYKCK